MKTSSAKAKGRRLQQAVVAALLSLYPELEADDILSRGMGQQGVDVMLSPAARRVLGNLAIECKNTETLNVSRVFAVHAEKYPKAKAVLVHSRNRADKLCTIRLDHFLELLQLSQEKQRRS